jgi:hypothetical protein
MINSHTEFQPLKSLLVGSVFEDSFFDGIKNTTIREGLKEIVGSTNEDIETFKKVLEDQDILVHQYTPKDLGYKDSILDYQEDGIIGNNHHYTHDGYRNGIPNPPLAIRDDCIVLGKKLVVTDPNTYQTKLAIPKYEALFGEENIDNRIRDEKVEFKRSVSNIRSWANRQNLEIEEEDIERLQDENALTAFCAPNLTRVGKTIIVDLWQCPHILDEYLLKYHPDYNYRKVFIGGHNDSVFSVIRPGLVLASVWFKPYAELFDGWDIIWFHETDWEREMRGQNQLKMDNSGCYWYPEKENNPQLEGFIDQWLKNWYGQSDESIFDVNLLMIDENTAIVNSESPYLLKELEKRGIDPVVIPLRNRFFWDGGWHCNTLDIYREGECEDYGL